MLAIIAILILLALAVIVTVNVIAFQRKLDSDLWGEDDNDIDCDDLETSLP